MALLGELIIGARKYGVVECSYDFNQSVDETGKPSSRTSGGRITFVMPTTNDSDSFFYLWMFNKTLVHDGVLRFVVFTNDNRRSYKTVSFFNAYCINLRDYFNNNDSRLMYTTVTISAESMTIGTATFDNGWS